MAKQRPDSRHPAARFADVILDSVADGVFTVDHQWRITSFNRAAAEITGVPRDYAIGRRCHAVFRANICRNGCVLRETIASGCPQVNRTAYIVRPDGRSVPISISTAVLADEDGSTVGGVETFRDLSATELQPDLIRSNSFGDIISRSHRMREIFALLPDVARSDSTVLVRGPSGTGKELVARAIHDLSPRRGGPLVVVNCGALPDSLLESELFGYRAGAFTDARKDKPGKIAAAEGGTLFLDEVGDVSAALQSRLLRVLQERTFEPLGDTRSYDADVRVVAATNKDLEALMRSGQFRQDLYYRLSVVELQLPDLRSRKEDIPLLVSHFLRQLSRSRGKDVGVSDEAMAELLQYDFPGNVRELQNVIEYAFIVCHGGLIMPKHLTERLSGRPSITENGSTLPPGRSGHRLDDLSAQLIRETLAANGNHRDKTARELGISKTTLWRRMKKYGIA